MHDEICSKQELKQFAYSDFEPSAFNFARWIESRSKNKYTVVETQLIKDAVSMLSYYVTSASDVNDAFKEKWKKTLRMLNF
jgi:hypothetical protein